jgi:hypothetical protein
LYVVLCGAEESQLAGTIGGAVDLDGFVLVERSAAHADPRPKQVWTAGRAAEMQGWHGRRYPMFLTDD